MSKEAFITKNFRPQTLTMIGRANAILEEYAEQHFTLTVHQLFYQFVARDLIENTFENHKLVRTVRDGRRAGRIDWDHIEDRGRELEEITTWECPEEHIVFIANWHHEDLWASQKYRPEDWIEKLALIGVIEPACSRWWVPLLQGWTDGPRMAKAWFHLERSEKGPRRPGNSIFRISVGPSAQHAF